MFSPVLDAHVVTVVDAVFRRGLRIDGDQRVGMNATQHFNLTMFGMERGELATARGKHQRVLFV